MKKYKNKIIVFLVGIIMFIFISLAVILNQITEKANAIGVSDVDLSAIPDGQYIGEYSIFPVYAKVAVTVKKHNFVEINILKHDNGFGSGAESIKENIEKEQSLNVDTISGATVSSKCILKAVENAIEKENDIQ